MTWRARAWLGPLALALSCQSGNTGTLDLSLPGPASGGTQAGSGSATPPSGDEPAEGGVAGDVNAPAMVAGAAATTAGAPAVTACNCNDSQVCVDGACLDGCASSGDCTSGSRSQCLQPAGGCVQCLVNADCAEQNRPLCGPAHDCVECLGDTDCVDPQNPHCVQSEGRCRQSAAGDGKSP